MVHPSSTLVLPKVRPPPITDRPPDAEPRQVSTPAAARPGGTTVGVVTRRLVVLAGFVMSIADEAPDVLPKVWAQTGVVIASANKVIHRRIVDTPQPKSN